jgi:hypothetical protein
MTPKIIPVELRDHLAELTGNELKVWMCYLTHANDESTAFLSDKTLGDETGLSQCTIQSSKKSLREKHWLAYTGDVKQPRKAGSQFDVPVMEVLIAGRPLPKFWVTVIDSVAYFSVTQNLGTEGSCSGSRSNSDADATSSPTGQKPPFFEDLEPKPEPKPKTTAKPEPSPADKTAAPPPPANGNGKRPYCMSCGQPGHWREACPEPARRLQAKREAQAKAKRLREEAEAEQAKVNAWRATPEGQAEQKRRQEAYYAKHPERRPMPKPAAKIANAAGI